MNNTKLKKFLFGSALVGSLAIGAHACSQKENDKDDKPKTEKKANSSKPPKDEYGNVELFESSRSDIKFALTFVENYYPYVYYCGEAWTTGHGLTVLYNADGTSVKVTKNTRVPTLEESDVYKGRYLTFEILPDIRKYVKVPMDKNTLLAACALRYCIGGRNFKRSSFLKQLNSGKSGRALAETLTGWRQQPGVQNRMYFFAALMCGEMDYKDLLDLRAEGCYNLKYKDMFVYRNGVPKCDRRGFYEWDFSKIHENLEKAKQPRTVTLMVKGRNVKVKCKKVKDVVPQYVWEDVNDTVARERRKNTSKKIGLFTVGTLGVGAYLYSRKKRPVQRQKHR